jgi:predicted N-acetyltransferase YhbS
VVIAPDRRKHADAVIDLMGKALPQGRGYYWMRDACRDVYLLRAHYDWRPSRIGLISNRVVTHFGIWDYQMRVGSARVRVGGVGGVATDADYRKRGLMDRTARASMEAMRAQGYDVSLLFGIDDFYHRFGYGKHKIKTQLD